MILMKITDAIHVMLLLILYQFFLVVILLVVGYAQVVKAIKKYGLKQNMQLSLFHVHPAMEQACVGFAKDLEEKDRLK